MARKLCLLLPCDMSPLASSQEEADTRLLCHASHSGFKKLMIHVADTDLAVIAIAVSIVLHGCEIWIALYPMSSHFTSAMI